MKKNYFRFIKLLAFLPIVLNAQISFPYTEDFGGSTTQSQWDFSNASPIVVENTSVNSPNGGTGGSLMYNFYNSSGLSTYNVKSPVFNNPTNAQVGVSFQFAAANRYTMPAAIQTVFADDHILLEYSTDGGQTYTLAHNYEIGRTGELNTGGTIPQFFTPTSTQWVTKTFLLPAGTNRVNFKGVKNNINQAGNFAYLDHVIFEICSGNTASPTGNSPQTFCTAQTLANLVVNGSNIKWYDSPTAGNFLPNNTALVNGTTYYASQSVGACESSNRLAVVASSAGCLSVNEIGKNDEVSFYPNPTKGFLTIKSNLRLSNAEIYNMVGQKVLTFESINNSINVSSLEKGVYILKYQLNNETQKLYKFIKE